MHTQSGTVLTRHRKKCLKMFHVNINLIFKIDFCFAQIATEVAAKVEIQTRQIARIYDDLFEVEDELLSF